MRLDRALSKLGFASRAEARRLILSGRVRIDDHLERRPDRLVVPERLRVEIDSAPQVRAPRRVLVLHKPRGVITTHRDPQGRQTVFDLLGPAGDGLVAVGRLDGASTGLLLLTNDTQLAHALTDPVRAVPRRYVVTVRGRVEAATVDALLGGVTVPAASGTLERLSAAAVVLRKVSTRESHLILELCEGRNREIRRMFDAFGHEVTRLHRVAFGRVELGTLQAGAWRELDESEQLLAELM